MANMNEDRGFNTIHNSAVEKRQKAQRMQKYTLFAVIGLVGAALIVIIAMIIGGIVSNARGNQPGRPDKEKIEWGALTVTKEDTLRGPLALVNSTHEYVFPEKDDQLSEIYAQWASHTPRTYMLAGLSKYMNSQALTQLDKMLTDFSQVSNTSNVLLRYAYRDFKEQKAFYENAPATAVKPGFSDHHTGYGCELKYSVDGANRELIADPTYNWLYENAHKYGFIVRYPADKVDLTGVKDYLGYFRYVGVAHASYMKANNLCMEEYITVLKSYTNDNPLPIRAADGKYYDVYYVAVDGSAVVKYPTNYNYEISGNNDGGVVVTVDRSEAQKPPVTDSVQTPVSTVAPAQTTKPAETTKEPTTTA